ncbi:hypothetical protein OH799_27635 [Nocardia sp. NBC_00881]|uniref:hypothetical protein n=1 Tax=Nocardia sp. NBC_00881 TaxID=2975995 RepID=UPI0038663103|nr:hypothetical protein OH799_27635 [Nocardia sp. NBC_00881]
MTVEDVAGELYGVAPAEFVAARTARVEAAKRAGDKELAAAVGKLRKPTVSAWTANLLAREAPCDVDALLRLGAALAAAQRELSADQLRDLTMQRQQLVNALAKKAGALAAEHGHPVGEGVLREVGQTLTAALAEPAVAERVRAGTLATAATYDGFGPSGPNLVVVPASTQRAAPKPEAEDTVREELEEALDALESARAARDSAQYEVDEAHQRLAGVESRIATLTAELTHAEEQRQFSRTAERSARDQLHNAQRHLDRAERRAEGARQRLDGE